MRPRPAFHITAGQNWLNDPNAPIFWRGTYHLFYQYNPDAPRWGQMRWGHVTSTDLVNWTDRGIALAPEPGGADADGCWSGSARLIDGRPVFHYTGAAGAGTVHAQTVLRAVGDDDLRALRREPGAPVVPGVEPGMGTLHQRDPYLLAHAGRWQMLLGTGLATQEAGAVVAWESDDALSWTYAGVIFSRPAGGAGLETGPIWECPNLVPVGDRWVLLIAVQMPGPVCLHTVWFLGDFDGDRFEPSSMGLLDAGDVFYAPSVCEGTAGRCLVWGWLQESPDLRETGADDFVGALSLPRELTVRGNRVVTCPAPEVEALWSDPLYCAYEATGPLAIATGLVPEFRLRFRAAAPAWITIGRDGQGRPVRVGLEGGALHVDAARPHRAELNGAAVVTIYVDHSIVEIFADDGSALTFRVDPELDCGEGIWLDAGTMSGLDLAQRRAR
jgi:beta-fructofuranosidase